MSQALVEPATGGDALSASLAALLDLSRRAREAGSEAEMGFLLVNDTLQLVPYRQAALWRADRGLQALSGLVQPEANAPYAQWLKAVTRHLQSTAARTARPFAAQDLPAPMAQEWAEWWPTHGLWLPLPGGVESSQAALLLARDEPWSDAESALLTEWSGAWWHALLALRRAHARPWWRPWARDTSEVLGKRRAWWNRPFLIMAVALAGISALPVRLSVLAPGELVPVNPVIVRAPLDGVVDVFHVKPNQTVKKGDPLFGFDEALIQSRLEVANQALATASTEYRQTLQQALSDPRVRPQLATLTGRIQEKRAEVSYLREQLSRARVLAPQDGVALFDDPTEWIGRPVSVGERILRIAATGDVEVEAWLPMADAIALDPGAPVQLYLNARPLEPVSASLRYLAHEAAQRPDGTFAYRVRATLDASTEHRVGLKGTAKLQGETVPAAWWVMRRPVATLRSALGL
jgi:multidrug efflux pump subunit AcrA (membrane-fusion protein)